MDYSNLQKARDAADKEREEREKPFENGKVKARLVDSENKLSRSGNDMWVLTFKFLEGPNADRENNKVAINFVTEGPGNFRFFEDMLPALENWDKKGYESVDSKESLRKLLTKLEDERAVAILDVVPRRVKAGSSEEEYAKAKKFRDVNIDSVIPLEGAATETKSAKEPEPEPEPEKQPETPKEEPPAEEPKTTTPPPEPPEDGDDW